MSLLTVGSVAFDAIETPFAKTDRIIGGSGTYISLAAAQFVAPINLVAVVGEDFPQDKIALLQARGVRTDGLQIKKGEKSFFWSGRYHADMNSRDTLVTELNVLADFDPHIPDSYQPSSQYLMLGNLAPSVQQRVLERLHTRPRLVVMDTMNFWMDVAMDDLRQMIRQTDVLSINDEEARQLSGEYSLRRAARKIMDMGPDTLIIKKGEHGALLFQGKKVFFAPALPLEDVFDPTGAGDTFAGGFVGYLAQTGDLSFENMKKAIIYGSALASFCVEQLGPDRLENLTRAELDVRVQLFLDLVRCEIPAN